jgi:hypothetical protein
MHKHSRPRAEIVDPWYNIVTPRKEVFEGRPFIGDEFATV